MKSSFVEPSKDPSRQHGQGVDGQANSDDDATSGAASNNDSACDIVTSNVINDTRSAKNLGENSTNRTTRTWLNLNHANARTTHIQTGCSSGRRSSESLERWHDHYDRLKDFTATGKAPVGRIILPSDYKSEHVDRKSETASGVDETDTAGQDGSAVGVEGEVAGGEAGDDNDNEDP